MSRLRTGRPLRGLADYPPFLSPGRQSCVGGRPTARVRPGLSRPGRPTPSVCPLARRQDWFSPRLRPPKGGRLVREPSQLEAGGVAIPQSARAGTVGAKFKRERGFFFAGPYLDAS